MLENISVLKAKTSVTNCSKAKKYYTSQVEKEDIVLKHVNEDSTQNISKVNYNNYNEQKGWTRITSAFKQKIVMQR